VGASVGPSVALLAIGVCFLAVAVLAALVIPRDARMTLPRDAASLPG
jgi:hypothetical protein